MKQILKTVSKSSPSPSGPSSSSAVVTMTNLVESAPRVCRQKRTIIQQRYIWYFFPCSLEGKRTSLKTKVVAKIIDSMFVDGLHRKLRYWPVESEDWATGLAKNGIHLVCQRGWQPPTRDTKSQNFPVGRISCAETLRTKRIDRFRDKNAPKVR